MKSLNSLTIALLIGLVITGCSSSQSRPDNCDLITIVAFLPPVVVDLDYKDIMGSQNQVIVQGGFQHALVIPGKNVAEQMPVPLLKFINNPIPRYETVFFEFNHYSIPPSELDRLNSFLREIDSPKLLRVLIEGHTDNKGSAKYNMALSIKRAKTVRDYLVKYGISPSKISIDGFGEELPLEPNNTEANQATNRRAVITPFTGNQ